MFKLRSIAAAGNQGGPSAPGRDAHAAACRAGGSHAVAYALPLAVLAAVLPPAPVAAQDPEEDTDPVAELVARLTLGDYKATLKGLTRFGDRRQGTQRNRDAVDWIEAWLQDVGCTNTERVHYEYAPRRFAEPPRRAPGQGAPRRPPPASRPRT